MSKNYHSAYCNPAKFNKVEPITLLHTNDKNIQIGGSDIVKFDKARNIQTRHDSSLKLYGSLHQWDRNVRIYPNRSRKEVNCKSIFNRMDTRKAKSQPNFQVEHSQKLLRKNNRQRKKLNSHTYIDMQAKTTCSLSTFERTYANKYRNERREMNINILKELILNRNKNYKNKNLSKKRSGPEITDFVHHTDLDQNLKSIIKINKKKSNKLINAAEVNYDAVFFNNVCVTGKKLTLWKKIKHHLRSSTVTTQASEGTVRSTIITSRKRTFGRKFEYNKTRKSRSYFCYPLRCEPPGPSQNKWNITKVLNRNLPGCAYAIHKNPFKDSHSHLCMDETFDENTKKHTTCHGDIFSPNDKVRCTGRDNPKCTSTIDLYQNNECKNSGNQTMKTIFYRYKNLFHHNTYNGSKMDIIDEEKDNYCRKRSVRTMVKTNNMCSCGLSMGTSCKIDCLSNCCRLNKSKHDKFTYCVNPKSIEHLSHQSNIMHDELKTIKSPEEETFPSECLISNRNQSKLQSIDDCLKKSTGIKDFRKQSNGNFKLNDLPMPTCKQHSGVKENESRRYESKDIQSENIVRDKCSYKISDTNHRKENKYTMSNFIPPNPNEMDLVQKALQKIFKTKKHDTIKPNCISTNVRCHNDKLREHSSNLISKFFNWYKKIFRNCKCKGAKTKKKLEDEVKHHVSHKRSIRTQVTVKTDKKCSCRLIAKTSGNVGTFCSHCGRVHRRRYDKDTQGNTKSAEHIPLKSNIEGNRIRNIKSSQEVKFKIHHSHHCATRNRNKIRFKCTNHHPSKYTVSNENINYKNNTEICDVCKQSGDGPGHKYASKTICEKHKSDEICCKSKYCKENKCSTCIGRSPSKRRVSFENICSCKKASNSSDLTRNKTKTCKKIINLWTPKSTGKRQKAKKRNVCLAMIKTCKPKPRTARSAKFAKLCSFRKGKCAKCKKRKYAKFYDCEELYLNTLRHRPHWFILENCPGCYPHCLSCMIAIKHAVHMFLFMLAICVWTPCLISAELCRMLWCCCFCPD